MNFKFKKKVLNDMKEIKCNSEKLYEKLHGTLHGEGRILGPSFR